MDNYKIILGTSAILLAAAAMKLRQEKSKKKTRRCWVRPWLSNGDISKGNLNLVEEFNEPSIYLNYVRMDENAFERLLHLVTPDIEKQNTVMRESISAKHRLIITLRFLATGNSYRSLMYEFRVSESTISKFVPEVCASIYKRLKDQYLKVPNTAADWLNIAEEFQNIWNFPHCLGAMDGKHIVFKAPSSAGSTYFNYKGTHSIVLLALVDARYNFLYVDVGVNGRISDGGVFHRSSLNAAIRDNVLNFPIEAPLAGRQRIMPYVIVADSAFALQKNIMKPFPFRNLTPFQQIYNYRLSRARRVVENAFGILANRFRVFQSVIGLSADKVEIITLACCALHNYLSSVCVSRYRSDLDKKISFKFSLSQQGGNRSNTEAQEIREEFVQYFNTVGRVTWQDNNC